MKDLAQAQAIFKEINGKELTESEIAEIQSEQESANQKPLFSRMYRFPIILAFLIAFYNQLSGINAFYSMRHVFLKLQAYKKVLTY